MTNIILIDNKKKKKKEGMFMISWIIGLVSMFSVVAHCWYMRKIEQPYLLLSKVVVIVSLSLGIPYVWDLKLQRFKMIGNLILMLICVILLASPYISKIYK